MLEFPMIDISHFTRGSTSAGTDRAKLELAQRVDEVCRETGFLAIVGHGVSSQIIDRAWDAARKFFDLPLEKKLEVKMPYVGYPYGYSPLQAEALAKSLGDETPPDLKESFSIGPLHPGPRDENDPNADFRYAANLWPREPREFRAVWTAYYEALGDLAGRTMRIFALALGLPEEFFEAMIDNPISAMRALNYPHQSGAPRPGQLRAGAHSDYGSLTILLAEAAPGGLEIRSPAGNWEPVPILPGAFVVNIGDLMARWTNDRWVSTLHRVVNPPPDVSGSTRRQSIAFFHQPNWDAVIECIPTCLAPGEKPKYAQVGSGAHLMEKFHRSVKIETAARAKGGA
ncbi:MAG TPA: 2-oxoglutarate and iron-dependent oxygenase domain-containing protein [archaeon]|nr:2-oxoglutarate and iron-dependent oxygenase domain-containing protein [archaeon]